MLNYASYEDKKPIQSSSSGFFWTENVVVEPEMNLALEYDILVLGPDGLEWIQAASKKGHLAQGVKSNM